MHLLEDHLLLKIAELQMQLVCVPGHGPKNRCMCSVVNQTRHWKRL